MVKQDSGSYSIQASQDLHQCRNEFGEKKFGKYFVRVAED